MRDRRSVPERRRAGLSVGASAWLASLRWRLTTALVVSVAYVLIPCLLLMLATVAPASPPPPPPPPQPRPQPQPQPQPPPRAPARSPARARTLSLVTGGVPGSTAAAAAMDVSITPLEFYTHHFPYQSLERLLTRNGDALCQREFALEGDFYKRYVVANDWKDLRRQVIAHPGIVSLHVGPVYSGRVARSAAHALVAERRELVFDIDLHPDYDYLTLNNADGSVNMEACDRAWPVCAVGAFLLQYVLENAFGFKEVLVVYSGRRGVHLWVFDEAAMGLSDDARSAIVGYVRMSLTEDKMRATTALRRFVEANQMLSAVQWAFEELFVREMGLLDPIDQRLSLVDRLNLSHVEALQGLHEDVVDLESGVVAWERVKAKVKATGQEWMEDKLNEVVLAYVWPRIDENVSLHRNHLLKSCFVPHPKTGRIAMPISPAALFDFSGVVGALDPQLAAARARVRRRAAGAAALHREEAEEERGEEAQVLAADARGFQKAVTPRAPARGATDIEDLGGVLETHTHKFGTRHARVHAPPPTRRRPSAARC